MLALAMILLLSCAGALADSGATFGVKNMPAAVKSIINNGRWSGWEVTGWVNPKGLQSDSACAFAAVKNGGKNDLLAFGWGDGGWEYKWHNAAALPQVQDRIILSEYQNDTGFMSHYIVNDELEETKCLWIQKSNGTWHLNHMSCFDPLMFYDTSVEGALRLYNTGWVEGKGTDVRVYGTYQTNLRYFDLATFPKTVKEAREKLTNPPKIPDGTLSAKQIQFSSGKKYKVYQGPGEEYGQAGNGKAVVSTNDWIQVFGKENGWIMIQYDISSDRMRMG